MSEILAMGDFSKKSSSSKFFRRPNSDATVTEINGGRLHPCESKYRIVKVNEIINFLDKNPKKVIITSAKVTKMTEENWEQLAIKMNKSSFSRTTQKQVIYLLRQREIDKNDPCLD